MKFYSEELNKIFDSEEELKKAEEARKVEKEKEAEKKALISKEKKACADIVKKADEEVAKAKEEFNKAREEASKIIEEAQKQAKAIVNEKSKVLSAAQEKRYDAIKDFNSKYGPYTRTYTNENAYNEWKRTVEEFQKFFDWLW